MRLVTDAPAHLEVIGGAAPEVPLPELVARLLADADGPVQRKELREQIHVNNARLGEALTALEREGGAARGPDGWRRAPAQQRFV